MKFSDFTTKINLGRQGIIFLGQLWQIQFFAEILEYDNDFSQFESGHIVGGNILLEGY